LHGASGKESYAPVVGEVRQVDFRVFSFAIWQIGRSRTCAMLYDRKRAADGNIVANAAVTRTGATSGAINVYLTVNADNLIHISDYFTDSSPSLVFYPLMLCRVVDTADLSVVYAAGTINLTVVRWLSAILLPEDCVVCCSEHQLGRSRTTP
jgi:hypothetical protein